MKRSFQSPVRAWALTAAGTLLIAATYGMARFGVGLLHPDMAAARPGVAPALPAAGAAQFASYCLAAAAALALPAHRHRTLAGAAGVVAALGCLGLATSTTAGWFVASAFVGGTGAGLASPALVGLLDTAVPDHLASGAQALVNAGTAVGVIGVGLLATTAATPTVLWPAMAMLCLLAAAGVVGLATAPPRVRPTRSTARPVRSRALVLPTASALVAGAASAATWTYGPTAVVARQALAPDRIGLLWVALGVGGLAGALVHRLVARWGPLRAFWGCGALMLTGSAGVLAPGAGGPWWALLGAATFGAAYMSLSGVLILWGRLLDPTRGAGLTAWLFITLAVGQAGGSALLGTALG